MTGQDVLAAGCRHRRAGEEVEGQPGLVSGIGLRADRQAIGEQRIDRALLGELDARPALAVAGDRQVRDDLVERAGLAEALAVRRAPVAAAFVDIDADDDAVACRQHEVGLVGIVDDEVAAAQALHVLEIEAVAAMRAGESFMKGRSADNWGVAELGNARHNGCSRRSAQCVPRSSTACKSLIARIFRALPPTWFCRKADLNDDKRPRGLQDRVEGCYSGYNSSGNTRRSGMAMFARLTIFAAACAMLGMAAGGAHAAPCGKDSKGFAAWLEDYRAAPKRRASTPRRLPTAPNTTPASSRSTATRRAPSRARSSSSWRAAPRPPMSARPRA